MSFQGKLIRGMKWYDLRNKEGLLPEGVSKDPAKTTDVNYYLDFLKGKDVDAVNKTLIRLRHMPRNGMRGHPEFQKELAKLHSYGLKVKKEVK